MNSGNGSGLVGKLVRVMAEISRVPKTGVNAFHKYKYVEEERLLEVVRERLSAENVFLFTSVEELSVADRVTAKGNPTAVTTTKIKLTFVDAASGEERTVTFYGQGEDPGDKGAYKSYSGGIKYALLKTFLIPTGDDPERDKETDERHSAPNGRLASTNSPAPSSLQEEALAAYRSAAQGLLDATEQEDLLHLATWKRTGRENGSPELDLLNELVAWLKGSTREQVRQAYAALAAEFRTQRKAS